MFQRTDRDSLKYLVCESTLQVYEVGWKRHRRYVLLRERGELVEAEMEK
jgi:hypothetical protein